MILCSYHPSLRFILPMMGGIVCGDLYYYTEWVSVCLPIFVVLWFWLLGTYRLNYVRSFGVGVFLFFFTFGFAITCHQLDKVHFDFSNQKECYQILLVDKPVEKAKSFQFKAVVEGKWSVKGKWHPEVQKPLILVYVVKDSLSVPPDRGDRLWAYTQIRQPVANHLPDAFDYGRYLKHHGVSGTAYVQDWKRVGHDATRTFKQMALDARSRVGDLYRRLGFRGDELSVLSALTLGDKETLGEEIQETYSVSGASHVLALSGLHVGFIYALLFFLLSPGWKRWPFLKGPLSCLIILTLWLFAFFTGLSVSVVRAVVMGSLCILLSFRLEPVLTFDTLLATLFLMLLYQPLWLFDVGFQLSFSAVAAILWLYPVWNACLSIRLALVRKVWSLIAVAIAAQLGTAPLIMYYFSHFSTHFLLTNLWVIPLVSLVMYASGIMLLLTPFPEWQQTFAGFVQELIQWQNCGLRWIEHLPYASVDSIHLAVWEVVWCYVCIYLGYRYWVRKTAGRVLTFLAMVCLGMVLQLGAMGWNAPRPGVVFYAAHRKMAVHCLTAGSHSWFVETDSLSDSLAWHKLLASSWNRMQLDRPQWVSGNYASRELWVQDQLLNYRGRCICIVSDQRWKNKIVRERLAVDYLCIVRGYRGTLQDLTPVFLFHTVVLDPSLSVYYRARILKECREMGLPCVEMKEQDMLAYYW